MHFLVKEVTAMYSLYKAMYDIKRLYPIIIRRNCKLIKQKHKINMEKNVFT